MPGNSFVVKGREDADDASHDIGGPGLELA
jgi:hypothetical protein